MNVNQIGKSCVIYRISAGDWCAYIGRCTTVEFAHLADARWNMQMVALLENEDFARASMVVIEAVLPCETEAEQQAAFDYHAQVEQHYKPGIQRINKPQRQLGRTTRPVQCIETGEIFDSAAAAAREYDVAPSQMSNHLKGMRGYSKIKGMRFKHAD